MKISTRTRRLALLLGFVTFLVVAPIARADTAYVTGGSSIYSWDTSTNTVTLVTNVGASLDSLIFENPGNIVYSVIGNSTLGVYNLAGNTNTFLANAGPGVADMTLEPSGGSLLVSNAFDTSINRVTLPGGVVTALSSGGLRPDGLAYDGSGHLFAVLGLNEVAQLDPVTGTVLKTISTPIAPDGLTFDSTTGMLYVGSDGNSTSTGGFYTVDTGLTTATFTNLGVVIDGVASNGNFLYLVQRNTNALQYDLTTNTITETSPSISGADDIAPLAGLGSPTPTPEPSSILLLATGLAGLAGAFRRNLSK